MNTQNIDVTIVGAGPVGLMCAYLCHLSGLKVVVLDKASGPLTVGRADALNARTLQLLEIAGLFDELYPLGKPCNTSSVWSKGGFVSRQSSWWEELQGCHHKHFLMLGQTHVEQLLDRKLKEAGIPVIRETTVTQVAILAYDCRTETTDGRLYESKFVIGADGSRSVVRQCFDIPFHIVKPRIIWAVIDAVIETDFPKVPEIIVFQNETSDVAWIPREGNLDRFYVQMESTDFSVEDAMAKVKNSVLPHTLNIIKLEWFSQFSVKESVAEHFYVQDRVFLAGDACHIHSVNGGQGLNTGLADAFNLIWKLKAACEDSQKSSLLQSYETERLPVAISVVETSGALVRSTKDSTTGTHATDYVKIVAERSGNITGMGIGYSDDPVQGQRLHDLTLSSGGRSTRLYSLLDYAQCTLILFGQDKMKSPLSRGVKILHLDDADSHPYPNQALIVRPDGYIHAAVNMSKTDWEKRVAKQLHELV